MRRSTLAALAPLLFLPACNSGLVAVAGGGSDSNSPSSISAFSISEAKQSPAGVRFRVVDADGDAVPIELYYEVPGQGAQLLTQLGGASNPDTYAGSPEGTQHELSWDFAAEPGLPGGGEFTAGVLVYALIDGSGSIVPGANSIAAGLGNDAPVIDSIGVPSTEITGVVPVGFELSDSSDDLVGVRVEFEIEGSGEWQLARPANKDATPELAIVGQSAPKDGLVVDFFWDTNVDLPQLRHEVRLRFTPQDSELDGAPSISDPFVVDNNEEALVVLDNGLLVLDAQDERGGIALPFTLRDQESDPTRVVFQWRFEGQSFPDLPTHDFDAVAAIQEDPLLRLQYQVCGPRTIYDAGRAKPVDATHVRLPELGTGDTVLTTPQYLGRELELLRHKERLVSLGASWSTTSLSGPVAALPTGDGLEALVLDSDGGTGWRLRRVVLATGEVLETLAQGQGTPTAMAPSPRRETLFVASSNGPSWTISQLSWADGALLGEAFGTQASADGVRGLDALSRSAALFTYDDELARVRFIDSGAQVSTVVPGLATPWGVAVDPSVRTAVFVAEHGADRVLQLDLTSRALQEVPGEDPLLTPPASPLAFTAPRALALERDGTRLLAVTEDESGGFALRATNLGSTHDLDASGYADRFVFELAALGGGAPAGLATGADGLRLVARPGANGIDAMGGVEQRRVIVEASPTTNVVGLDAPLAPELDEARPWRVSRSSFVFQSSPEGENHVFAWDADETVRGGNVLLRALPFDSELGVDAQTSLPRSLQTNVLAEKQVLDASPDGDIPYPVFVDLDGDGDLDVLVSELDDPRYHLQVAHGEFAGPTPLPLSLTDPSAVPLLPEDLDGDGLVDLAYLRNDRVLELYSGVGPAEWASVPTQLTLAESGTLRVESGMRAVDLDADRDLDLLLHVTFEEEEAQDGFYVFYQQADGSWSQPPVRIGSNEHSSEPRDIALGDVDGNGRIDIVAALDGVGTGGSPPEALGSVSIFLQDEAGAFAQTPIVIGEPAGGLFGYLDTDNAKTVALADLDEDGDLDVVAGFGPFSISSLDTIERVVVVYWQSADGTFGEETLTLSGIEGSVAHGTYVGLRAVDFDDDGDLDLVAQGEVGVYVFVATAPGVFDPKPISVIYETIEFFSNNMPTHHPIQVGDVEGDGDLDLLFANIASGEVELHLQRSRGVESFSTDIELFDEAGVLEGVRNLQVGDWNSDGSLDLATSHGGFLPFFVENNVQVRFQATPRNFSQAPLILSDDGVGTQQTLLRAADLNQDGVRDLVVTSTGTNEIQIFFQEEQGLQPLPGLELSTDAGPLPGNVGNIDVVDYDLDGQLEIVALLNWHEVLFGFDQVAPGQLEQAFRIDVLEPGQTETQKRLPMALEVADLDESGPPSIVVGTRFNDSGNPERWLILPGTGPGTFSSEPVVGEELVQVIVKEVDLEGDGDLDLVSLGVNPGDSDRTVILQMRGEDGSLVPIVLENKYFQGGGSEAPHEVVELTDIDADGDLDLLFLDFLDHLPSIAGGELSVYEQIAPGLFSPVPRVLVPESTFYSTGFQTADLDGDGELDVALLQLRAPGSAAAIVWGNE